MFFLLQGIHKPRTQSSLSFCTSLLSKPVYRGGKACKVFKSLDDGLDYLDRLTFGGRADVPSRGEELLMSGALGEDDGDDELFMI